MKCINYLGLNKLKLNSFKLNQFPIYKETRTRILFWYAVLMILFVVAAIPTTRQRLYNRVDHRVKDDMQEEIEDFEALLLENLLKSTVEPKIIYDQNALNPKEQINLTIYRFFDEFIDSRIPEDDNFLIAIVDGQFYKSSSTALPAIIRPGSKLMERWEQLTDEERREEIVPDPSIGSVLYKAIPIKTSQETLGVFVIAHMTSGERQEALEALDAIIEVLIFMLAIALMIAWFVSGRVLYPIRQLADTVKAINESDLSQRIKVQGEGELAELGNTFNEMMNRLESSFAIQRDFINDAGHELRTPITIIRGHLELMGDDPQEQEETIKIVLDELDRMNRLVEDLILLAKAERPDFLESEVLDLTLLTKELFSKIKTLGDRSWRLEKIGRGVMIIDRQRLTQAIINLANNALQHSAPDSLIALGSRTTEKTVEFWVRDSGEGIDPQEQKRIFDRFARVKSTHRRSQGSGLGLAIVKAIVEAHKGSIHLESRLGVGSTFTLIFPLESK